MLDIYKNVILNLGGIAMLNAWITFPIIFKFFVISKIEKQVGEKIDFKELKDRLVRPPRFVMKNLEVSFYIVLKCIMAKIAGKLSDQTKPLFGMTLQRYNYRIESASWFVILMSFLVILNALCFLIMGAICMVLKVMN